MSQPDFTDFPETKDPDPERSAASGGDDSISADLGSRYASAYTFISGTASQPFANPEIPFDSQSNRTELPLPSVASPISLANSNIDSIQPLRSARDSYPRSAGQTNSVISNPIDGGNATPKRIDFDHRRNTLDHAVGQPKKASSTANRNGFLSLPRSRREEVHPIAESEGNDERPLGMKSPKRLSNFHAVAASAAQARAKFAEWKDKTAENIAQRLHIGGKDRSDNLGWQLFPMLGSALQIPFAAFTGSPPIILAAMQVKVLAEEVLIMDDISNNPLNMESPPSPRIATPDGDTLSRSKKTSGRFRIQCTYGPYSWNVHRDMFDFYALHTKLQASRILRNPRQQVRTKIKFPSFPSMVRPLLDEIVSSRRNSGGSSRAKDLQEYLLDVFAALNMTVDVISLCDFLQFSAISFDPTYYQAKPWECSARKRVKSHLHKWLPCFLKTEKQDVWLVFGESWITLLKEPSEPFPFLVILVNRGFKAIPHVRGPPGFRKFCIQVDYDNAQHCLEIQVENERLLRQLEENLIHVIQSSHFAVESENFNSFAPIRKGCHVEFFVDATDYFNSVANAIDQARKCVYILDWWLTPELYLKRPIGPQNESWRLDRLLHRKAKEGVHIYILVYKEVAAALSNNSWHTKFYLLSLHPNIHVQRHPDALHTFLWAHHEKAVIVDNSLTLMGGLDLCLGRYDNHHHVLLDKDKQIFPGQDYSNPRVGDFRNVDREWQNDVLDRSNTPRLPWHDVACSIRGTSDVARHFVQRWNHIKLRKASGVERTRDVPVLQPPRVSELVTPDIGPYSVQITRSLSAWSCGITTENSILYAYSHYITNAKHFIFIENQFFVTATTFNSRAKNRIGEALFERINKAHTSGQRFRVIVLMPLLPGFAGEIDAAAGSTLRCASRFHLLLQSMV
jgi:phosphatidylserine/phosphatidylglycerophosphate/cardiolipin synthase-like enzyme